MAVQSSFVNRVARVQSNAPTRDQAEVIPKANIRLPIIGGGLVLLAAAAGLAFTLAASDANEAAAEEVVPVKPVIRRLGNG